MLFLPVGPLVPATSQPSAGLLEDFHQTAAKFCRAANGALDRAGEGAPGWRRWMPVLPPKPPPAPTRMELLSLRTARNEGSNSTPLPPMAERPANPHVVCWLSLPWAPRIKRPSGRWAKAVALIASAANLPASSVCHVAEWITPTASRSNPADWALGKGS